MVLTGFHLEVTNICTLKCSRCSRTMFIEKYPNKWTNYNLNLKNLQNFLDINLSGLEFNICGTYGDPIYYSELFELCKWLKSKNANIQLVTNGSYKKKEWWQELATILNSNDKVVWSIDGTPNNFTQYRINADWETIKTGIEIITKTNINTCWKYIVFNFNQENIEEAKALSKSMNIQNFKIEKSYRWIENDDMKPDEKFVDKSYTIKKNFTNEHEIYNIEPNCINTGYEHYISADGFYSPCCYIADHAFYYKTMWGKNKKFYKISDNTISTLFKKIEVINFYNGLNNENYPSVCKYHCGVCKN